ncbi:MAG: hypothetical protein K1X53_04805 [Candidatus Sumerlaeaceae bacterium]|nr:hypothetical protein [Candidatus Sumerlaeaceae bacterium]
MTTDLSTGKASFIRSEFECFVRIGSDSRARARTQSLIEQYVFSGALVPPPAIYLEARDSAGNLREMWYLETDSGQLVRLMQFLRRFSVEDVRLMDSMLNQ